MTAQLPDHDLGFQEIWKRGRGEPIAAGFYEHAREWRNTMTAVKEWLRLEKPRAKCFEQRKIRISN